MFGIKTANSAVAFVSFGHKKFTSRVPMRVLSEDRDFGAHVMRRVQSAFAQERGNAAHPAAGHADQMNAMMFAREKLRQTELHARGRHTAVFVYFSIVSTTALAAFLVESLAAFCDMRSRRPRSSMKGRSFRASASSKISDSFTRMAASAFTNTSALRA